MSPDTITEVADTGPVYFRPRYDRSWASDWSRFPGNLPIRHNEIVDRYSEIVGRYSGLVDRYNGLVDRNNGLVDRSTGKTKKQLYFRIRIYLVFFLNILNGLTIFVFADLLIC